MNDKRNPLIHYLGEEQPYFCQALIPDGLSFEQIAVEVMQAMSKEIIRLKAQNEALQQTSLENGLNTRGKLCS